MDTIQHAYLPAVTVAATSGTPEQVILAGIVGALPDVVGFAEKVVKRNWNAWGWYNEWHSKYTIGSSIIIGAIAMLIGWTAVGIGLLGMAVHVFLDQYTHGVGKRWWHYNETLWAETTMWAILAIFTAYLFSQ